jgi:hypothetical protein
MCLKREAPDVAYTSDGKPISYPVYCKACYADYMVYLKASLPKTVVN